MLLVVAVALTLSLPGLAAEDKVKSTVPPVSNQTPIDSGPKIDTDKLDGPVIPPVKPDDIPPDRQPSIANARVKLVRVRVPTVDSIQTVTIQGRGKVDVVKFNYAVEVVNEGDATGFYTINTVVPGAPSPSVSRSFSIPRNERQTKEINIQSEFALRGNSMRLPVTVKLTNPSGREMGQLSANADVTAAMTAFRARSSQRLETSGGGADLAVSRPQLRINLPPGGDIPRLIAGFIDGSTRGRTIATVTIRNAGRERWGYPGKIRVRYLGGKIGDTYALEGATSVIADLPPGLQPGASATITLNLPRALAPGFYYTAQATIESDRDSKSTNNSVSYSFFVEDNGAITDDRDSLRDDLNDMQRNQ
jgi:hypothetical protein